MNKKIILILIVIALGVTGFFVYRGFSEPVDEDTNQEEVVELETYTNEKLGITLVYPNNLNVDAADDGRVTFSVFGPSQTEFTEVFDGMAVSFFRGEHTFDTFEEFAKQSVVDWEVNGTIGDPLKEVRVANTDGYTFEGVGAGRYRFYFLPIGEQGATKGALQIVVFVADPTEQGFQSVVDSMFDSLTLN